ncbi:MAG TPA: tRNA lysidine(34) synthetase TilS [Symbiobacteriaceae bacterium]|nr:tRNA lysidine(34) synthetase TilS [Symbiobacteriaceae bacterium]
MLEQVRAAVHRHRMLSQGDRVIVAVSGGPDSVALLHVLHSLAPALGLALHIFHMDHGLRGESSAQDAQYVQSLADSLGHPCSVVTLPARQLKSQPGSLQANARSARYEAMEALAARTGANRVALGHNRDDQAETVLMRFLRGTGTRGLAGIPPVRDAGAVAYVRPLLEVSRAEIEQYCRDHELSPRHDPSNSEPTYLRNRLRLELLPHLAQTYNPTVAQNLAQLAAIMREEDQLLDTMAMEALRQCRVPGEGVALAGNVLRNEPLALARRVVRLAAREALAAPVDLGLPAVDQVLDAASRREGSQSLHLPHGLQVTVEYGICRFHRTAGPSPIPEAWPVSLTGATALGELGLQVDALPAGNPAGPFEAAFDLDRLPGPLSIRFRQEGDRIWPTGMEGSKKLQDLLVDAKVPRRLRDRIPLLVSGDEILWIIGHRLDRRYLAGPASRNVVLFRITFCGETF